MTPDEQQAERQALQTARDAVDDAWQRADYHRWTGAPGNAYHRAVCHLRRVQIQHFINALRANIRRRLPVLSLLAVSLVMSALAVLALYQTAHGF